MGWTKILNEFLYDLWNVLDRQNFNISRKLSNIWPAIRKLSKISVAINKSETMNIHRWDL